MHKQYNKEEKSKQALEKLLEMFRTGTAPEMVARTVIRRTQADGSTPSDNWSLGNHILMLLADTEDARGFKQWQEVGRTVKKGSKAFYILAPCTRKFKEKDKETGEEKDRVIITGFKGIPVFKYEDTEGADLPARQHIDYSPETLPPLYEVARTWGINVKYLPMRGNYYGRTNGTTSIELNTHEAKTFYHELSHCAHAKIRGGLKGGQHADQEIVAEFSAAVLAEMYGGAAHGNTWNYIKGYSGHDINKALKNILRLINEIEQVISLILATANDQEANKVA
jgi:antirestriction protein ArdC